MMSVQADFYRTIPLKPWQNIASKHSEEHDHHRRLMLIINNSEAIEIPSEKK